MVSRLQVLGFYRGLLVYFYCLKFSSAYWSSSRYVYLRIQDIRYRTHVQYSNLVSIKLPYLTSTILSSKLSKGMGHNYYGEPAWPNDILYIFPIVIFGLASCVMGLACTEPIGMGNKANPFATPYEILPEWYLFPTFNLLRVLPDKFIGVLSLLALAVLLLILPFGENLSIYQNPMRRPCVLSIFISMTVYAIWLAVAL